MADDGFDAVVDVVEPVDSGSEAKELTHIVVEVEGVVLGEVANGAADGERVVEDAVAADDGVAFGWRELSNLW